MAAALVFDCHGLLFRMLCDFHSTPFEGLSQASRASSHQLPWRLRKKLLQLDQTAAWLRHISSPKVKQLVGEVQAELKGLGYNGVPLPDSGFAGDQDVVDVGRHVDVEPNMPLDESHWAGVETSDSNPDTDVVACGQTLVFTTVFYNTDCIEHCCCPNTPQSKEDCADSFDVSCSCGGVIPKPSWYELSQSLSDEECITPKHAQQKAKEGKEGSSAREPATPSTALPSPCVVFDGSQPKYDCALPCVPPCPSSCFEVNVHASFHSRSSGSGQAGKQGTEVEGEASATKEAYDDESGSLSDQDGEEDGAWTDAEAGSSTPTSLPALEPVGKKQDKKEDYESFDEQPPSYMVPDGGYLDQTHKQAVQDIWEIMLARKKHGSKAGNDHEQMLG